MTGLSWVKLVPQWIWAGTVGVLAAVMMLTGISLYREAHHSPTTDAAVQGLYSLDGFPAPNFALTDQFGHTRSLASFRGKEVVLSFVDTRCTNVCPLTAEQLVDARRRLGQDAQEVVLVAVNANPIHNRVADVRRWSREHHVLHRWLFLTGSEQRLRQVYRLYRIRDQVDRHGNVTHDAGVFVIDNAGEERYYSETMPTKATTATREQVGALYEGMRQWLPLS